MNFNIDSPLYGSFIVEVDDEDSWVLQYNWIVRKNNNLNQFYVTGTNGVVRGKKLHRLLMGVDDRNVLVDHWDHNTFNNKKLNLRVCSSSKNCMNRSKSERLTTSKYKGVIFTTDRGHLICRGQIRVGDKLIQKRFPVSEDGELDAARWYDEQAIRYFGEYAYLNGV